MWDGGWGVIEGRFLRNFQDLSLVTYFIGLNLGLNKKIAGLKFLALK